LYSSLSDDEAELIQIDENLIRANLSDAERILRVARRKQLYEKLHPETKHGGDRRSAGARSSSQNENLKAFVADIAVKTGKGRSTVARDVTRAKKVAVLDDIAGTCLDKGDEIDALGKLPEGEQRKLATAASWQRSPDSSRNAPMVIPLRSRSRRRRRPRKTWAQEEDDAAAEVTDVS
jgi:ParB family transcriptional regulator, chromosome partitioning protein